METYTFNQFPSPYYTVHLALFRNVANSAEIRRRLIEAATMAGEEGEEARRAVQFGFLDASVVSLRSRCLHELSRAVRPVWPRRLVAGIASCEAYAVESSGLYGIRAAWDLARSFWRKYRKKSIFGH